MELFDTHCHLDVPEFVADRDAVLAQTRAAGGSRMVVPAIDAAFGPSMAWLQSCARPERNPSG